MLMVVAFLAPRLTYSQVLYGSLTGNVTDQKGASVPGVKVEARNVGTGVRKETSTNGDGICRFGDLQPGTYSVTYALTSFKTLIQENITVETNTMRRVDAQLQVADVKETVVVTSEAAPLQTVFGPIAILHSGLRTGASSRAGAMGRLR